MRITIAEIVVLALSFQSAVFGRATQSSNENDELVLADSRLYLKDLSPRAAPVFRVGGTRPGTHSEDPDPVTGGDGDGVGDPGADGSGDLNTIGEPDSNTGGASDSDSGGSHKSGSDTSSNTPSPLKGSHGHIEEHYAEYKEKGEALDKKFMSAINNNEKDATIRPQDKAGDTNTGTYAKWNNGYTVKKSNERDESDLEIFHPDLKTVLQFLTTTRPKALTFFEHDNKFHEVSILSNLQPHKQSFVNVGLYYTSHGLPRNGAIVHTDRNSEYDPRAKRDHNGKMIDPLGLPSSEIAWQQWTELCKAESEIKGLRAVISSNIVNKKTLAIIDGAHLKNNFAKDKPGRFWKDPKNPARNDAFFALLNTDNIKPTVHMLKDHHNELGNLKIKEITTFHIPDGKNTLVDLAIKLG
ncbi:hypothetical protein BDD12DRAFT_886240 [Trichophaea hybrida]|nr:hypothetical protein BDD12DRAFT_886240 [Trichophaea hybrida]